MLIVSSSYKGMEMEEVIYSGEDISEAWEALKEDLLRTATQDYSIAVVDWWFTNNENPGEVVHPNGCVDIWSWS